MTQAVLVQAHRGLSAEHPENSYAAFRAAADTGFGGIELDLRASHDHYAVVHHDAGLERTTNGHGQLHDLDWPDIETLDAGDGRGPPRLDHLLAELADWQGHWNLEIKDRSALPAAVRAIREAGIERRTVFTAMDPKALRSALERAPEIQRGLITLGPPDVDDLEHAAELGCAWMNVDHDFLDARLIERLHGAGLLVGAWTVNDEERAVELVQARVDAIITDSGDVLAALL